MFERAIAILKQNMLLHFAYADFEESHLKYDKVHQIYNDYLDQKQIDPTLVSISLLRESIPTNSSSIVDHFAGIHSIYEIRPESRRY